MSLVSLVSVKEKNSKCIRLVLFNIRWISVFFCGLEGGNGQKWRKAESKEATTIGGGVERESGAWAGDNNSHSNTDGHCVIVFFYPTESRLCCDPRRVKRCCCCCWPCGCCDCCCCPAWGGGKLTNEAVPNSLYQPITMLDKSRSSSRIWATPMNTFRPSMRP